MFKYGKTNGIMAVALAVLAVIPLIEIAIFLPQMSDTVVIGFNAVAETARTGSRWHLALLPVICLALGIVSLVSALKRAGATGEPDHIAALTFKRYVKSGLIAAAIFNAANLYLIYMAMTGQGIPFAG